jgi:hypothetical protein
LCLIGHDQLPFQGLMEKAAATCDSQRPLQLFR